ncbi:hypothetical protein LEM8419_01956 [Neolewinella maritima]|uniref:GxxExxY protein n=2 Tax=Neolewinella maritima TaxID=1383882 RepID=A0ABM9B1K5_9BACT|nr:hypothetical protein LEM8419_01956 [Neolewinella maritima]
MLHELRKQGYRAESQLLLPITYDEIKVDGGYRIDILVEDLIILELKAVEALDPIHTAQLLTYLRLADKPLGLLMNFNVRNMQHGIKRYIQ